MMPVEVKMVNTFEEKKLKYSNQTLQFLILQKAVRTENFITYLLLFHFFSKKAINNKELSLNV